MEFPVPDPGHFDDFRMWLRTQKRSEHTINHYIDKLSMLARLKVNQVILGKKTLEYRDKTNRKRKKEVNITKDVIVSSIEELFAHPDLEGRNNKIMGYRSYIRFLRIKKHQVTREDELIVIESIMPISRRGNNGSTKKWSVPKEEWDSYIRRGTSKVAKMIMWLGFYLGLRSGEIIHLRIDDIDFDKKEVMIRDHRRNIKNNVVAWNPKYNRERQIPLTDDYIEVLKRWINEVRPDNLDHPYLLWTEKKGRTLNRQGQILLKNNLEKMMSRVCDNFHAHVLRYSFATHWYNESKDIKLISDLLGHADVATTSNYLALGKQKTMGKGRALFAQA